MKTVVPDPAPDPRAAELGRAVRLRRRALGLTQTRLAEITGQSQPAISRLESGGALPPIAVLNRIAAALRLRLALSFEPLEHD